MSKRALFAVALVVIVLTGAFTLFVFGRESKTSKSEIDTAVNQARFLYQQRKGEDLSKGPCLSNALMPGWVVDIVHNPRLTIDDLPENQCSAYIEGKLKHFVELDTEGNLIKAK